MTGNSGAFEKIAKKIQTEVTQKSKANVFPLL